MHSMYWSHHGRGHTYGSLDISIVINGTVRMKNNLLSDLRVFCFLNTNFSELIIKNSLLTWSNSEQDWCLNFSIQILVSKPFNGLRLSFFLFFYSFSKIHPADLLNPTACFGSYSTFCLATALKTELGINREVWNPLLWIQSPPKNELLCCDFQPNDSSHFRQQSHSAFSPRLSLLTPTIHLSARDVSPLPQKLHHCSVSSHLQIHPGLV